jgi:hypothetical protein
VSSTVQVREASGALAAAVDALVGLPVEAMGPAQLQALIAGVGPSADRLVGLLSAAAGRLQDSAGGTVPTRDGGSRTVASWLAEARCTSPAAAGGQLRIARLLRSLPAVAAAVLAGVLTQDKAAVLARLVGTIEAAALIEAQPALIAVAADRDPAELAAYVSQLIATHCEPALDQDMAAARRQRFWQSRPDGALVRGSFAFPAEDFETVATVLGPLAGRQGRTDDRTAGQRRADAAVEVFEPAGAAARRAARARRTAAAAAELRATGRLGRPTARPDQLPALPPLMAAPPPHPDRHRHRRPARTARPARAGPAPGRVRLRHRRLDRPADPPADRSAALRRPDQPRPARPHRPGPRTARAARHRHPHPTPSPGRPRQRPRPTRLHPPSRDVRRPPPHPPGRRRTHHHVQPGPAVPTAPPPVAPRNDHPPRPAHPLASQHPRAPRPSELTTVSSAEPRLGCAESRRSRRCRPPRPLATSPGSETVRASTG